MLLREEQGSFTIYRPHICYGRNIATDKKIHFMRELWSESFPGFCHVLPSAAFFFPDLICFEASLQTCWLEKSNVNIFAHFSHFHCPLRPSQLVRVFKGWALPLNKPPTIKTDDIVSKLIVFLPFFSMLSLKMYRKSRLFPQFPSLYVRCLYPLSSYNSKLKFIEFQHVH